MPKYKKRPDGRYARQITVGHKDGRPVKRTVYGRTLSELEENYLKAQDEIKNGTKERLDDTTLSELAQEWYVVKRSDAIKEATVKSYRLRIKRIVSALGDRLVREITPLDAKNALDLIKERSGSYSGSLAKSDLTSMFRYAISRRIIQTNPCDDISISHIKNSHRALTDDEIKAITDCRYISIRDRAIVLTLLYTGLRKGEAYALNKEDIDLEKRMITINKTLIYNIGKCHTGSPKTQTSNRVVPIFAPLLTVLSDYLPTVKGEIVFPNKKGKYCQDATMQATLSRVIEETGIGRDITMHCFRHTFITQCYNAGIDVKQTQAWVGHSDLRMTLDIYTHLSQAKLLETDKMDKFYARQK